MISPAPFAERVFRFDGVTIDAGDFRALKNGLNISLTPRAFDVLLLLIQNRGHVVEKQEIFDAVWKDTIVSDSALTKVIKEIRHAIGDSATEPRYIETVPKRGYRFIGIVEVTDDAAVVEDSLDHGSLSKNPDLSDVSEPPSLQDAERPFAPSRSYLFLSLAVLAAIAAAAAWLLFRPNADDARTEPVRSMAVLPFKSLDAASRDESLEMGMAETLITRLSSLKNLAVRPIGAVRKYSDPQQDPVKAGQEIGAEAVLDGTIQKAGERIRVTVRLIDVSDGNSLWSEQFDENFTEIFRVQDSIAERVTNALALRLNGQEKEQLAKHSTDNTEAYQLYLNAQLIWHTRRQKWIEQSLDFYKQAVEKDPNFALAYIGIADCYMMLYGHRKIPVELAIENAKPAILKALEIDGGLAQAHNALAELKYQFEYDWGGAETEFKRAIELNPNVAWIRQAYGWYLMTLGRFDEANIEMEKAHELDPNSLTINAGRGRLYYYSRQYDRAAQHFRNLIAIEPQDGSLRFALFTVYERAGMYEEAMGMFVEYMIPKEAPATEVEEFRSAFETAGWKGVMRKQLEKMEERVKSGRRADPIHMANLNVGLGRKDKAFFWLQKAFDTRQPATVQFKIEPAYDILRDDPRYAELLRKIGLQP